MDWELFYEIFDALPRGGPGDAESTRRAFAMLTNLPPRPLLLDIGCGPGKQTLEIARLTQGHIVAVDKHYPFLAHLQWGVAHADRGGQIDIVNGDMFALGFANRTFDVIWAEGSIFIMGFAQGLEAWKPLLKDGGYLAVTELTLFRPDPPQAVRDFFAAEGANVQDLSGYLGMVEPAGYELIGSFALPESAWWDGYYTPLEAQLKIFLDKYRGNDAALELAAMFQTEIDIYRQYSEYYGYVFYVMRKGKE